MAVTYLGRHLFRLATIASMALLAFGITLSAISIPLFIITPPGTKFTNPYNGFFAKDQNLLKPFLNFCHPVNFYFGIF